MPSATFQTPEYERNVITIPVSLSESVESISPTDFDILSIDPTEDLSGDGIYISDFECIGSNSSWKFIVRVALGYKGVFSIRLSGNLTTVAAPTLITVSSSPTLLVPYNTIEPEVVNFDVPKMLDDTFNYFHIDFRDPCVGLLQGSFEYGGTVTDPGMPILEAADTDQRPTEDDSPDWMPYNDNTQPRKFFRIVFDFRITDTNPIEAPKGSLNVMLKDGECYSVDYDDISPIAPDLPSSVSFTQNQQFSYTYNWELPDGVTISGASVAVGETLPTGISITHTNHSVSIQGTATTIGDTSITLTVSFSDNSDDFTHSITINVLAQTQSQSRSDTGRDKDKERTGARQTQSAVPSLTMNDPTLYIGETFDVTGTITGNPIRVYVEGLLRRWTYTYENGTLHVLTDNGDNVSVVESGIWKVVMVYIPTGSSDETEISTDVNWQTIHRVPVISNPGDQTFYLNRGIGLKIDIANTPSGSTLKGLLAKMSFRNVIDGVMLTGFPDRLVSQSEGRMIKVDTSNSGGDDEALFGFTVVESSGILPPVITVDDVFNSLHTDNPLGAGIQYDDVNDEVLVLDGSEDALFLYSIDGSFIKRIELHEDNSKSNGVTIDTVNDEILVGNNSSIPNSGEGWYRYERDGTYIGSVINTGLPRGIREMSFDSENERVLLIEPGPRWRAYDLEGNLIHTRTTTGSGSSPNGIAYKPDSDTILIGDVTGGQFGWYEYEQDGTYIRRVRWVYAQRNDLFGSDSPLNSTISSIAYDTTRQEVLVLDTADDGWYRYALGAKRYLHVSNGNPQGIAFDSVNGEVLVVDNVDESWYRYNPDGTYLGTRSLHANNNNSIGITFDSVNGEVLVLNASGGLWYRYNPDGTYLGTRSLHANNDHSRGITFDSVNGEVLTVDMSDDLVYRYNPDGTYLGVIPVANETFHGISYNPISREFISVILGYVPSVSISERFSDRVFYRYQSNGTFIGTRDLHYENVLAVGATFDSSNAEYLVVDGQGFWFRYDPVEEITDESI